MPRVDDGSQNLTKRPHSSYKNYTIGSTRIMSRHAYELLEMALKYMVIDSCRRFLSISVHLSPHLRRRPRDDWGVPLPSQAEDRHESSWQQWRLPGQSSGALGTGGGDWTSPQTGNQSKLLRYITEIDSSTRADKSYRAPECDHVTNKLWSALMRLTLGMEQEPGNKWAPGQDERVNESHLTVTLL